MIYDRVRIVTRLVKQVQALGQVTGQYFQDRTRSIRNRLLSITKVLRRCTGEAGQEARRITAEIADIGTKVLQAASKVLDEVQVSGNAVVKRIAERLLTVQDRTARVIEQARRVNAGHLSLADRLVSIFDPDARPIRRGKLKQLTEFGYKVRLTESEERLITECKVIQGNPPDSGLPVDGVTEHCRRTGRVPKRAAAG